MRQWSLRALWQVTERGKNLSPKTFGSGLIFDKAPRSPMPQIAKTAEEKSPINFEPPLDLEQAARVLGMHPKTLEGKAREHKIPAFKVGKRWRFRLSSLDKWLENGLKSNTTDHAVLTGQEQHP